MKSMYVGGNKIESQSKNVSGEYIDRDKERFYKISNYDHMSPFFISITSNSDLWLFISSLGGLTAGRRDRTNTVFPYASDDKIHDASETTGSKTLVIAERDEKSYLWYPFSNKFKGIYEIERNMYKNIPGNKIIFEEINKTLNLSFIYSWNMSDMFGFVRQSSINNLGSNTQIQVIDGIQNYLPDGVDFGMQMQYSTLLDGYKRNELVPDTSLAIATLSSIPIDRAIPNESLKATTVYSLGLDSVNIHLSKNCFDNYLYENGSNNKQIIRAKRNDYFIESTFNLKENQTNNWFIIIDLGKDVSDIVSIKSMLNKPAQLLNKIVDDIEFCTHDLERLVGKADGLSAVNNEQVSSRHFSNTLFNIMRGGIFENNYKIDKKSFVNFIKKSNLSVLNANRKYLNSIPSFFEFQELEESISNQKDPNLSRLYYEYFPLSFSRRHGDPARPWNFFSIEKRSRNNENDFSYQGNWRDIFQNWEVLSVSYPERIESMISKFLNATTSDGYNPYRLTNNGIDWEVLDPNDPWSNIGYWGDHQIIYLLKFLELSRKFHPDKIDSYLDNNIFSYANVPYRIKDFDSILNDSNDTIIFDEGEAARINEKVRLLGSDGKLVLTKNDCVLHVNMTEKLLVTLLTKMSNFIPEAGIWLNTQRPEWNDANNALVGNGCSMVTLYYMKRMLNFCNKVYNVTNKQSFQISKEVYDFFSNIKKSLNSNQDKLSQKLSGHDRRVIMEGLGIAGSNYRKAIYKKGFSGKKENLNISEIINFITTSSEYIDHSIKNNLRDDNLYHAYNLVQFTEDGTISIRNLPEMLEGQVAILTSGFLNLKETNRLLTSLKNSKLWREDRKSYYLYPDRNLPSLIDKNVIPLENVLSSKTLSRMIEEGDTRIINKDIEGKIHFNDEFRNSIVLNSLLQKMNIDKIESEQILNTYETVFDHESFTGRSGSFSKYEGLGCTYWHMVSKLRLTVIELLSKFIENNENQDEIDYLKKCYHEITDGLGFTKDPENYGAFPSDPYSHSPSYGGVEQPGMTGQVKEDILSYQYEIGLKVDNGKLVFKPITINKSNLSSDPFTFEYFDHNDKKQELKVPENSLVFTYCQTPIIYSYGNQNTIELYMNNESIVSINGNVINQKRSAEIFTRKNNIKYIKVIHSFN